MEIRQYIRADVAASAAAHLSLVALVVIFTEIRPFVTPPEVTVAVDVVVADEPEKKPDPQPTPTPQPSPDFAPPARPASQSAPAAAAPPPASPPQKAAAPASRHEAAAPAQSQPQPQPQPQPPSPQAAAMPGYIPAQPDLTIKYHVMLGLPEDMPVPSSAGDKQGEGGDTSPAKDNLSSSLVEPLRQHLKTCSKLPAALSLSDNVAVKLRVQMTPDGRLAAEPILIEGSASVKGVELMRSAVAALSACQPYAELPKERYGEWKVLDLSFTPHDFNS
jgi:outer membrane biosynthesis protein TonB